MATNTTNYGWTKPDYEDAADIMVINGTIDNIDAQVKTVETALDDKADKSTTYTKTEVDTALDSKADTSDIPTVPITAIQKNGTGITPVSGTVNITVPTTAADVSALPDTTKYAAALSLTINSSTYVMTGQLKDQNGDNLGTAQTIDLPLESVVVGGSYNSQTKKVVLTLQNGNTIEFSVADLVSGLQTELSASNKLNPAYINYDSTHRAVSDTEKSTWNGKQNALSSAQLDAVNSGITSEDVAQIKTNKNNISIIVDSLQKNFFKPTITSGVDSDTNLTITVNSDNTITVSGTATTSKYILISQGTISEGNYVFSGTPAGITVDTGGYMRLEQGSTGISQVLTPVNVTLNTSQYTVFLRVLSGKTYNHTLKPMLCTNQAWTASQEYEPYCPSLYDLYQMILNL